MKRISFHTVEVAKDDPIRCDCCNEPLAGRMMCRFDGGEIDNLYEGEHVCPECMAILPQVDFLSAAYQTVRNYRYLKGIGVK